MTPVERKVRDFCPPDVDAERWVQTVTQCAATMQEDVVYMAEALRNVMDAYPKSSTGRFRREA